MARSRTDRKTDAGAPLRLRVPASLAVALFGASTTVALAISGCNDPKSDPSVDAGALSKATMDAGTMTGDGTVADGGVDVDADIGGGDDAPIDIDAAVPPPDAPDQPPPPDAYVPPPDGPDH